MQISNSFLVVCVAAAACVVVVSCAHRTDAHAKAQVPQANANREIGKDSLPKGPLVFRPLEAPPLAVSVEKQQKLSDLLRQYQADEVTPEQYHEQRAKILAGP